MRRLLRVTEYLLDAVSVVPFVPVLLVLFLYSRWRDSRMYRRREGIYRDMPLAKRVDIEASDDSRG